MLIIGDSKSGGGGGRIECDVSNCVENMGISGGMSLLSIMRAEA